MRSANRRVAAGILIGLGLGLAAAAGGDRAAADKGKHAKPGPERPAEALERDLKGLRAHLQNMRMRLRHDVRDAGGGARLRREIGEASVSTLPLKGDGPAVRCCAGNLEALGRHVQGLEGTLGRLQLAYEKARNTRGAALARELRKDAAVLRELVEQFPALDRRAHLQAAVDQAVRELVRIQRHVREIEACCNGLELAPPS